MKKIKLSHLYLVIIMGIMYLPIIYLMVYAFNEGGTMNEFTGFTLDHFVTLLSDKRLLTIVLNTIIVALLSAFIATIIGTCGAIAIYDQQRKSIKNQILSFNNILLVMPDVMIGASFLILFTILLPIRLGFWTVLCSHIAFNIPIVVLMVLPKLYGLNASMFLAAEDLGASPGLILRHIVLPNISSGIMTGFFMALTYSLDDFAVTFFVTGSGYSTLSVEIYSRARQGISLEINALSTIIFLIALAFVLGYFIIQMREIKHLKAGQDYA